MIQYAMAGLSAGLSLLGSSSQEAEKIRQVREQNKINGQRAVAARKQEVFNNVFRNYQVDVANENRKERYKIQNDQVRQQYNFNAAAANRASISQQVRMNETAMKFGFQENENLRQLLRAEGSTEAAGEGRGKSYRRARAMDTTGRAGTQRAIDAESLASARGQHSRNLQTIQYQKQTADNQAYSSVAVIPEFSIGVPMPQMSMPGMLSMPSRNTGLMIGNALMGGMQAGMAYTAPGDSFLGITKPLGK
jgi:hypothetical protein